MKLLKYKIGDKVIVNRMNATVRVGFITKIESEINTDVGSLNLITVSLGEDEYIRLFDYKNSILPYVEYNDFMKELCSK